MKLLGHYVYFPIALLAGVEFVAAVAALVISTLIFFGFGETTGTLLLSVLKGSFFFGVAVLVGLTSVGLYQAKQRFRIEGALARVLVGLGIAAICIALVDFVFSLEIGRRVWAVSFVLCVLLLGTLRVALWRWIDHATFQRRVLVYGAGERAANLLKLRRASDRRGFNIVAFVPAGDGRTFDDPRVTTLADSLLDYARANDVDEVVVAMDDRRQGFPVEQLLACRFAGIAVVDLLEFLERETGRLKVDLINPAWLIFSEGFEARLSARVGTRILDLVCSFALLTVAAPFMFSVAIAILIEDRRSVLYRQRRVGLGGRPFTLYKFRSMVENAEADGKARWAGAGDSRVTRVGAIIRKLRLDELPQLFNVIHGDMSLVGPRPERPEFVDLLSKKIPYYQERHCVKPGITGWAQLLYPYGSSDEAAMEKLQFDLYYIKHKSLIFDLMVLLQTAEVVLWRKGAR